MFVDQIPGQEQWEYPHWRQVTQPPSCSSFAPHSGQKCIRPAMSTVPRGFGAGGANSFQCPCSTCWFQTFSITRAIASGQDVHLSPGCRMVDGQRMPRSWLTIVLTSMPLRREIETRRAVASLWDGHQPALPVFVKTSQMPLSS